MAHKTRSVGILIFDDVEVLDFCGPFEVFSVTGHQTVPGSFEVCTIGPSLEPISARNGLSVNPQTTLADAPQIDLLLIPGGQGTRALVHDEAMIDWIRRRAEQSELVLPVCTVSLLLAQSGMLDGLSATTHHAPPDLSR